jgi:Rieske Fe-S protein
MPDAASNDVPNGADVPSMMGMEVDTMTMAASIAVGQIKVLNLNGNTITIVVGRDGMGYYAMDGLCTHQQCPVRFTMGDPNIGCTCNHGSTFAFDGALLSPATRGGPVPNQQGLPHFAMRIDGTGKIFVTVGSVVANGVRVQAM